MKKILFTIALSLLIVSCHDDDVLTNIDQEGSFPKNLYSIPVDSALNYLYEFINEPSSNSSARVVSKRVVKSLIPIKWQ